MNKLTSFILLLLFVQVASSQNLSFNWNQTSMSEALEEIESKSDYRFYFSNDWLKGLELTGNFQGTQIEDLLTGIFNGTKSPVCTSIQ